MRLPIPQNHPALPADIQRAGCLFRSLSMLAEIHAGHTLSVEDIIEQYEWLCEHAHMSRECFVYDHVAVIKSAQYYLDEPQFAEYVYRAEGDDKDFGYKNQANANYYIGHSHTGRHGHFWVADRNAWPSWDPYFPTPARVRIIGYRGYRL